MKPRFFKAPADFRAWLEKHHADTRELWVGFYKKASGKVGITYNDKGGVRLEYAIPTRGLIGFRNLFLALWTSRFGDKKVRFQLPPQYAKNDLLLFTELIEAGKFRVVIDRLYPLEDVVEAARYVETEQKTGNVVLTVS